MRIGIAEWAREGHSGRDADGIGIDANRAGAGRRETRPAPWAAKSSTRLDQRQGDVVSPWTHLVRTTCSSDDIQVVGRPRPEQHARAAVGAGDRPLARRDTVQSTTQTTRRTQLTVKRDVHGMVAEERPVGAESDALAQERAHDVSQWVGSDADLRTVAVAASIFRKHEEGQVRPRRELGIALRPTQLPRRIAEKPAAPHARRAIARLPRLRLGQRLSAPLHLERDPSPALFGQDIGAPVGLRVLDVHGLAGPDACPRDLDLRQQMRRRFAPELTGRRRGVGEVLDAPGARSAPHLHDAVGAARQHKAMALEIQLSPCCVAQERGEDGPAVEQSFEWHVMSIILRAVCLSAYRNGNLRRRTIVRYPHPVGPRRVSPRAGSSRDARCIIRRAASPCHGEGRAMGVTLSL